MEQTYLTEHQCRHLEYMGKKFQDVLIFHFPEIGTGVCVGIRITGMGNAQFAVSIASETESLYRYDVAEYHILLRFVNFVTLPMQFSGNWKENNVNILGDAARQIAHSITAKY